MEKWKKFNDQCINYALEIQDPEIRQEFILYNLELLPSNHLSIDLIDFRMSEIKSRFGKHIPSLLTELRDEKIKSLIDV